MAPYQMTERESRSDRPVGISPNAVIIGIVSVILIIFSSVLYVVVIGRDVTQIVALVSLIGAPTLLSLFNLIRIDRQKSEVETIRKNTNGALERMQREIWQLGGFDDEPSREWPPPDRNRGWDAPQDAPRETRPYPRHYNRSDRRSDERRYRNG